MTLTKEMWESAILGAVVSAFFAGTISFLVHAYRIIKRLSAIRRLLGPICRNESVAFFSKRLYSKDGTYLSDEPNYFPSHTQKETSAHLNIPYVVSTAQMGAAADIMQLLGQVGRQAGVNYLSADTDWDVWDQHLFVIGGSHKSNAIFSSCEPRLVELVQYKIQETDTIGFRLADSDEKFSALNNDDYGLILKTKYPPTGVQCFVVMGIGSLGTEAAAYFLRKNAVMLGRAYGGRSFAVLVHARLEQGKQSARLRRWNPIPTLTRVLLHPSLWAEYMRIKKISNKANSTDAKNRAAD
jgi:hypothetical protein